MLELGGCCFCLPQGGLFLLQCSCLSFELKETLLPHAQLCFKLAMGGMRHLVGLDVRNGILRVDKLRLTLTCNLSSELSCSGHLLQEILLCACLSCLIVDDCLFRLLQNALGLLMCGM